MRVRLRPAERLVDAVQHLVVQDVLHVLGVAVEVGVGVAKGVPVTRRMSRRGGTLPSLLENRRLHEGNSDGPITITPWLVTLRSTQDCTRLVTSHSFQPIVLSMYRVASGTALKPGIVFQVTLNSCQLCWTRCTDIHTFSSPEAAS